MTAAACLPFECRWKLMRVRKWKMNWRRKSVRHVEHEMASENEGNDS